MSEQEKKPVIATITKSLFIRIIIVVAFAALIYIILSIINSFRSDVSPMILNARMKYGVANPEDYYPPRKNIDPNLPTINPNQKKVK